MFDSVWKLRGRLSAFALSLAAGLLVAALGRAAAGLFVAPAALGGPDPATRRVPCLPGESFDSPEAALAGLRSNDVGVRAEVFRRLFLRPGASTTFYDYARDKDFPERAEGARLRLVNLDESPGEEALITFVRNESPVAILLSRGECGWQAAAAVSSWLRFEDYPYDGWLEVTEEILPGRRALLVRDSTGDAAGYTRRARLLALAGGRLEQVAEFEEESIQPVAGYAGAGWGLVKRRRTGSHALTAHTDGAPARLRVEYREDVIRYTGAEPSKVYWREGDGVWHEARRHWRTRRSEVLKPAVVEEEQFVWSGQANRFVAEGP